MGSAKCRAPARRCQPWLSPIACSNTFSTTHHWSSLRPTSLPLAASEPSLSKPKIEASTSRWLALQSGTLDFWKELFSISTIRSQGREALRFIKRTKSKWGFNTMKSNYCTQLWHWQTPNSWSLTTATSPCLTTAELRRVWRLPACQNDSWPNTSRHSAQLCSSLHTTQMALELY